MVRFIIYLILTTGGMALFKLGSRDMVLGFEKAGFNFNMSYLSMLGMGCYLTSFVLWLLILKDGNLSVVFPVAASLAMVITTFIGVFLFHEKLSLYNIFGICFILVGVVLLNLKK